MPVEDHVDLEPTDPVTVVGGVIVVMPLPLPVVPVDPLEVLGTPPPPETPTVTLGTCPVGSIRFTGLSSAHTYGFCDSGLSSVPGYVSKKLILPGYYS